VSLACSRCCLLRLRWVRSAPVLRYCKPCRPHLLLPLPLKAAHCPVALPHHQQRTCPTLHSCHQCPTCTQAHAVLRDGLCRRCGNMQTSYSSTHTRCRDASLADSLLCAHTVSACDRHQRQLLHAAEHASCSHLLAWHAASLLLLVPLCTSWCLRSGTNVWQLEAVNLSLASRAASCAVYWLLAAATWLPSVLSAATTTPAGTTVNPVQMSTHAAVRQCTDEAAQCTNAAEMACCAQLHC
jgi:hypothetical protein